MVGVIERVPEDWQWALTTRAAVAIVSLVALLSIATGVVNLDRQVADFGPVGPMVPNQVQQAVGFTGAVTGVLMLVSAFALRRRLRIGWYASLVLLPATAIQGLLQASAYSLPLVVLSVFSVPTLLLTRSRFDRQLSLTPAQLAAGGALAGVQLYGTVGAFALEEHFDGIDEPLDAFYFTLITSSTVGYGDVVPESPLAQVFTMSVIVLGVASFGIAIGALVGPAIQARISTTLGTMTDSTIDLLDDHVLVAGTGDLTEPILEALLRVETPAAVVTERDVLQADLDGIEDVPVLTANPSDERPLERAGIDRTRAILVATDDDARDALTILAARQLAPDTRIVAAATDQENRSKLSNAGADVVLSPAVLGASLLVRSALGEESADSIESLLDSDDGDERP